MKGLQNTQLPYTYIQKKFAVRNEIGVGCKTFHHKRKNLGNM